MIEQSVIGIFLKNPKLIPEANLKAEHFQDPTCLRAFATIVTLWSKKDIVPDVVSVAETMGGNFADNVETLTGWLKETASTKNIDHYAARLKDIHKSRTVKAILREALESQDATDSIRANVITQLSSIEEDGKTYETGGKEWMGKVLDKVQEVWDAKISGSGIVGISTGIPKMDEVLGGFHDSDLVIMGARPKMGKTAWMMNAAKAAALSGKRVGIASAEMPDYQLGQRIVADVASLKASAFREGFSDESQFHALSFGAHKVSELPIRVFDKPRMTVGDIAVQAKSWQLNGGIDILFVDYLTRLSPDLQEKNNRTREVGKMVSDLKTIARTMNIPVVCLAQLSRDLEKRENKRPMPSDLRDSGEVEQEADVIMFLYRDHVYNKNADPRDAEILIQANRHGPTGGIKCNFDGEFMRWTEAEFEDPYAKNPYGDPY